MPRYLLWLALRVVWLPWAWVVFRQRAAGADILPREGPYLLFANHVSTFDSPWQAYHLGRPAHFMASASMFRRPMTGFLLRAVLAFPKQTYVRDRGAMEEVQALYDAGQIIQIMPEGTRTWDGRPHAITAGTGRLVKRMGARVVVCRIRTGQLWWPRWATWPRWVPVACDFLPPRTWPEDATAEQITADIQQALDNECVHDLSDFTTFGFRMAEGLPVVLWACPACFAIGGLRADGNIARCTECEAAWRLTVEHRMLPVAGEAEAHSVATAADALTEHFGSPPIADRARFDADGLALDERGRVVRLDRHGADLPLDDGWLQLTPTALALDDVWKARLDEIVAIWMDVGNVLLLRTDQGVFRVEPASGATRMWEIFLRAWWEARPTEAAGKSGP